MARLGVRSGSVAFARWDEDAANNRFERTGANGCERSRAFAMQKVVGSSPIIRSERPANQKSSYSLLATLAAAWLHLLPTRGRSWPGD
jgi:hypothetical protein